MRKYLVGVGETVSRNGQPVGLGLACWPREWKPDDGRAIGVEGVGVGFHFNVGHLLKGALKDVGKIASAPERLAVEAVKDPKKLLHDIGKDVGKVAKIEKFVLEQAQGLISLVPGLGTAISTAIGAGLAALEGGSALDIAIKIAYAAIPIPPGIKTFTDLVLGAVLDVVNAVVKGGDLAKVLERLIAEELSKALPDDVRAAGTNVLTTLTPTVLQALTGKLPSATSIAATVPGVPGLPAIPSVSSLTSALPAGLPSIPSSIPSIPGVTGVGDKVDDFEAQLKSQYAALNLPANVKSSVDPIFNALVSMVHSMNVGPAILLAVRTGISSKLPAGVARDVGLHIFDTLAHLILGKLFKGKPTQARVASQPTPAQLTAIHRAAALGQPLPASVTPVPSTAAAYKPLGAAEKANSTEVTVALPSALGVSSVYGPYPQSTDGAPAKSAAAAMTPPPIPAAPSSAPTATTPPTMPPAATAGTTAGVGEIPGASPSRTSTDVRSPTRTSTEVRSPTSTSTEVRSPTNTSTEAYTADNFTATVTGGAGAGAHTTVNIYPAYFNRRPRSAGGVAAFPSHAVQPPQTMKGMLREVMATPPPTGVIRGMMREAMGPSSTAGVGSLDRGGGGGGHGGGGGRGGGGGGHGGGRSPGRPGPNGGFERWGGGRGRAWGRGGGYGWGGGAWWPYVVVAANEVSCATWGAPIDVPAGVLQALRTTLIGAAYRPVAVRGSDGGFYLLATEQGGLVTVRPCASMGVGDADDDVLRAMALDLLAEIKRTGAPQGATRSARAFAQAWNTASADQQIATDGKYTREIEGALNAALSGLAPGSGAAPTAVL